MWPLPTFQQKKKNPTFLEAPVTDTIALHPLLADGRFLHQRHKAPSMNICVRGSKYRDNYQSTQPLASGTAILTLSVILLTQLSVLEIAQTSCQWQLSCVSYVPMPNKRQQFSFSKHQSTTALTSYPVSDVHDHYSQMVDGGNASHHSYARKLNAMSITCRLLIRLT